MRPRLPVSPPRAMDGWAPRIRTRAGRLRPIHGFLRQLTVPAKTLDEVRSHVPGLRAWTEAGVEPELEGQLVIDARTTEEENDLVAPTFAPGELDEGRPVLLVAISLGDDLAHEHRVGMEGEG